MAGGAVKLDALKTKPLVGQGPHQGRTCGPLTARLMRRETDRLIAEAGFFRVCPSLKPTPLGDQVQERRQ